MKNIFTLVVIIGVLMMSCLLSNVPINTSAGNNLIYTPITQIKDISNYNTKIEYFNFTDGKHDTITVYYVLPINLTEETKVIFVMHSSDNKNGRDYAEIFQYLAEVEDIAVLAPDFSNRRNYPNRYQYVNIRRFGRITPYEDWTFHKIDAIFEEFIYKFQITTRKYILYGHSAGAQFTARTMMFSQSEYLDYAIASAAGTYTFFDENYNFPSGIRNLTSFRNNILNNLSNRKLYILIGNNDINRSGVSPFFNRQGRNRYERAINFFESGKQYSIANDVEYKWEILVMNEVAHSSIPTLPYVLDIIKGFLER